MKLIILIGFLMLSMTYGTFSYLNPTLSEYQQTILTAVADREAEIFASADRRAIDQEAARLATQFLAVRYDAHRLDTAVIQRNHPLLGPILARQTELTSRTLTENLAFSKEQALKRVMITRDAMRYSILVDLTTHTKRLSYGAWSNFSTCQPKGALSYTGFLGRFYERLDHDCLIDPTP